MHIAHLCYELYKIDWKFVHNIKPYNEEQTIVAYYEHLMEREDNEEIYTYEDYLEEFGYNGEIYASYIEFLGNEYLEDWYMHLLLDKYPKLTELYDKDMEDLL